ncbi:MAG: AI-2E family transporter [Lysobacter sp.]|nr:AI-2E family transporter [Lysobacter sp.]
MTDPEATPASAPVANGWGSSSQMHALVLMALTLGGLYLCYRLASPFLPALAWALALAVLFAPAQRWLEAKLKYPSVAATINVLIVAVIVVLPATFIGDRLISEAISGAETITALVDSGQWRRNLEAYPLLAPAGHWIERQFDLPGMVNNVTAWLTNTAASLARESVLQLIGVVLTFYMLFYFLRDRRAILRLLRSLLPLSETDMSRLFADVGDTVHATVYGTLAVAVVQGTLGGLMFWWLGLPAPLLWGIVMGLLAVVPVLGAFIVWIPAAIFLLLDGSGGKALLLALWGGIVVGGIDNLLYPMLVGRRLKMHTVIAFVSIVGGLILFGSSGLILGPLIFAITRLLLEVWSRRNASPSVGGISQRTPASAPVMGATDDSSL